LISFNLLSFKHVNDFDYLDIFFESIMLLCSLIVFIYILKLKFSIFLKSGFFLILVGILFELLDEFLEDVLLGEFDLDLVSRLFLIVGFYLVSVGINFQMKNKTGMVYLKW